MSHVWEVQIYVTHNVCASNKISSQRIKRSLTGCNLSLQHNLYNTTYSYSVSFHYLAEYKSLFGTRFGTKWTHKEYVVQLCYQYLFPELMTARELFMFQKYCQCSVLHSDNDSLNSWNGLYPTWLISDTTSDRDL